MTDAELKRLEASNGARSYNLDVELDQEGRDRLWLYSRGKVGTQLLLVLRGIAVAAPRIDHELSERRVTITQLEDEGIAEETLNAIKKGGSGDKKP
jgi:preprotein translocase subunit SecD